MDCNVKEHTLSYRPTGKNLKLQLAAVSYSREQYKDDARILNK